MKRRAFFATPLLAMFDHGKMPPMPVGELVTFADWMEWDGNGFLTSVVVGGKQVYASKVPYSTSSETLTVTSVNHESGTVTMGGDHMFQKVRALTWYPSELLTETPMAKQLQPGPCRPKPNQVVLKFDSRGLEYTRRIEVHDGEKKTD